MVCFQVGNKMFTCLLLAQVPWLSVKLLTSWQEALWMRKASQRINKGLCLCDLISLLNYNLNFVCSDNDSAGFGKRISETFLPLLICKIIMSFRCLQRDWILGRASYFFITLEGWGGGKLQGATIFNMSYSWKKLYAPLDFILFWVLALKAKLIICCAWQLPSFTALS